MEFVGEYGILLALVLTVLWCWGSVRRRASPEESVSGVAGTLWAPLAASVAVLVNIPIRGFVERPRPFHDHDGLDVLVDGKTDFSFVSDHATVAMALGVGLFLVHKRIGLAAIGLALAEGFCRVYMGVHYPTDVVGGFALGTAVALLLAPSRWPCSHRCAGGGAGAPGRPARAVAARRRRRAGAPRAGPARDAGRGRERSRGLARGACGCVRSPHR